MIPGRLSLSTLESILQSKSSAEGKLIQEAEFVDFTWACEIIKHEYSDNDYIIK